MKRVVLLGAGPTNLATADRLLDAGGFEVTLVERLPWPGGLAKSFTRGPYTLDLGPHRFTPHSDEVYQYVRAICGDDLRVIPQRVEIYLDGRFVLYPFKLLNLLSRLSPLRSARILFSFLAASLSFRKGPAASYEEWVTQRFGREITGLVFRPLIEKVWGLPLSQLAARFAYQRMVISSLWEVAWEVLRGKRQAKYSSPYYPPNHCLYPRAGYGSITDGMSERVRKKGGVIRLEATATQIVCEGGRVVEVRADVKGAPVRFPADWVVSSLPINLLPEMLAPPPADPKVGAAARALRFRSLILLYLVVRKERVSPNTHFYFPDPAFPFGRASEMKNYSADTVPSSPAEPRTVFTVEIPCWREEPTWQEPDDRLFERAVTPLEACGLIRKDEVEEYFTVRLGYVYPVWDVTFEANLQTVLDYVAPVENLILNGRPGMFFYNNLNHSLEMGFLAAAHILSGKSKRDKWIPDTELFKDYRIVE